MKPKEDRCVYCEIKGYKNPRVGVCEIFDPLTNSKVFVCEKHKHEFNELTSFFQNFEEYEES